MARSKEIAARMLGDEMMIMSGRDSTLFTLNEVASSHLGSGGRRDAARRNRGAAESARSSMLSTAKRCAMRKRLRRSWPSMAYC